MKKVIPVLILLLLISSAGAYFYIQKQSAAANIQQPAAPTAAPAAPKPEEKKEDKTAGGHLILDGYNRVLGGIVDGKWVSRDMLGDNLKQGLKFMSYSQTGFAGEFEGKAPQEESYISGEKGYYIEASDGSEMKEEPVVSVAGEWNVLPRIPLVKESGFQEYEGVVAGQLKANGMADSIPWIKKVVKVDLEGDGTEETFIIASSYTQDDYDSLSEGNFEDGPSMYSMIVMQKVVDGTKKNIVISSCYKDLVEYGLSFVADVDGDGSMEFLITAADMRALKAEGFALSSETLYDMVDMAPSKVFTVKSNPV